jgi:hypothetical protein
MDENRIQPGVYPASPRAEGPHPPEIESWVAFQEVFADAPAPRRWIYRGSNRGGLASSLERACRAAGIGLENAPGIERLLVREFRRNYRGADADIVASDTLYCMGLMRHFGAPTRLLDWTYSPYVALFFAIRSIGLEERGEYRGRHEGFLWALDAVACREVAESSARDKPLHSRFEDDGVRNDETFRAVYLEKPFRRFVLPENPWTFHERHQVQQGVFLCPGDVSSRYESNLAALGQRDEKVDHGSRALRRYTIRLTSEARQAALLQLHRANITEASLFPGLDGFARSLGHRLPFFLQQLEEGR